MTEHINPAIRDDGTHWKVYDTALGELLNVTPATSYAKEEYDVVVTFRKKLADGYYVLEGFKVVYHREDGQWSYWTESSWQVSPTMEDARARKCPYTYLGNG